MDVQVGSHRLDMRAQDVDRTRSLDSSTMWQDAAPQKSDRTVQYRNDSDWIRPRVGGLGVPLVRQWLHSATIVVAV